MIRISQLKMPLGHTRKGPAFKGGKKNFVSSLR